MSVVLVTGAGGFLGGACVRALLERGEDVVALVRDRNPNAVLYTEGLIDRCVEVREDLSSAQRLMEQYQPDLVLHLAAQSQVQQAALSPTDTFESNIRGSWQLLEACRLARRWPKGILVASSDKAYGASRLPYVEESPLSPVDPYDVSKAAMDLISRSYAQRFGLPIVVTRCANIYGPGDLHGDRLVPSTCRSLLQGTPVVLRSTGDMVREWLYVEDAVQATLTLLDRAAEHPGEAFNVGSGETLTVNGILGLLFDVSGRSTQVVRATEDNSWEIAEQSMSSARVRALGWEPRWTLREGLAHTWRWHVTSSWVGGRIA